MSGRARYVPGGFSFVARNETIPALIAIAQARPRRLMFKGQRGRKFAGISLFFFPLLRHVRARGRAVTVREHDLCTRVKSRVATSGKRNWSRAPWKSYRNKRTRAPPRSREIDAGLKRLRRVSSRGCAVRKLDGDYQNQIAGFTDAPTSPGRNIWIEPSVSLTYLNSIDFFERLKVERKMWGGNDREKSVLRIIVNRSEY